jgi:hypothetical protein
VQAPTSGPGASSRGNAPARGLRRVFAAVAGLLAAAVALGVAELIAGFAGPASSPVVAVGDAAITLTPESVKHFAITTFGENDKIALVVGTLVVIALYALLIGLVGLWNRRLGMLGIAVFGVVGAVAALTRPEGGLFDALPSLLGAAAGSAALLALLAPLSRREPTAPAEASGAAGHADEQILDRLREVLGSGDRKGAGMDRRGFFVASGVALGAAAPTWRSRRRRPRRRRCRKEPTWPGRSTGSRRCSPATGTSTGSTPRSASRRSALPTTACR